MRREISIKALYLFIGLIALLYILIRAVKVGVTYDEVWTINGFVPFSFINILNYTPCDANNHIINTLLIKLLFTSGNHSLFVARSPNIIAFVIYLFFGYKIAGKYLSPLIGVCCYSLLLLNPFLLDFFSIARGYGLSLGFLLASLYYLLRFIDEGKVSNVWKTLGIGAIAVICNFSLLNFWASLAFVINGIALSANNKYNFKKVFLSSISITTLLVSIIFEPIRKLIKFKNLYYGGSTSFYSDTLSSLAKYTFYSPETSQVVYYSLNTFLCILIAAIAISFFYKRQLYSRKNIILSITTLCIVSVTLQHYLFGTLYLIDRTALFFYPLLILCLCFSINDFSDKSLSKIIVLITFLFGVNFINHANVHKTATWYFDARSQEILNDINEKGKRQNKRLKIDFSWPFQSSFSYYTLENNYPFVEIVKNKNDRELLNTDADIYIYLTKSLEKVGYIADIQKIVSVSKDTTNQYKTENILVFEHLRK